MLDHIIKGQCIALHNTALLEQVNANLRAAKEKIVKKRTRSTKLIPCEEFLTGEESLEVITQLDSPAEAPTVDSHTQGELPNQAD
jgi:hypothetical protein